MEELNQLEHIMRMAVDYLVEYSFQIVGAIVTLLVGIFIARKVSRFVTRLCEKRDMDVTLSRFLGQSAKVLVLIFVLIVVIGKFGISIAPFIAALGALIFGASFAIQGPLSNYGAGLVIILTRPFVVGDTIEIKGANGVVEEIKLASTILSTEDGEMITIPNKHIIGEVLVNSFGCRIVEACVGISYDSDPEKAIALVKKVVESFSQIPDEPAPIVGIAEYGDSAINIGIRYWVPTKEYYKVSYAVNLDIFNKFKETGITIPFPQRVVHKAS